jgi:hypothetical protein
VILANPAAILTNGAYHGFCYRARGALSLDQSPRVPLHSIKRKSDVVPIEHHWQTFHGSRCIARSRLKIFTQDAPSVINRANEGIVVGIIHNCTHSPEP